MKKKRAKKPRDRDVPLTLHPLGFDEALGDLLHVKPPPKPTKKQRKRSRH